jgi:hypothetical protein
MSRALNAAMKASSTFCAAAMDCSWSIVSRYPDLDKIANQSTLSLA